MPGEPEHVLDLIEARRRDDVTEVVREVLERRGVDAAVALLAAVQSEVGSRWQSQRWTVADEHAASAIVDHALAVAGEALATRPGARPIAVACVEDEWHVIPARMLAEQLRSRGWDPVFLGASAPAGQLGRFVERAAPVAVALSCSMPVHLPGARRSVQACHDAGVPVVVGGSAFPDRRRADAIGADAWCADVDALHDLLEAWATSPPPLAEPTVPAPVALDVAERHGALDRALDEVLRRVPPLAAGPPHAVEHLRADLDGLLASAEAAAQVDDRTIVPDQARWLRTVSEARGEPRGLTAVALEALATAVPADAPLRRELAVEV